MEIEKKYLVTELPADLDRFSHYEIQQGYLFARQGHPVIRLRKKGEQYILTYKYKNPLNPVCLEANLNASEEVELFLTRESYEDLLQNIKGILIEKTRYEIPYGDRTIELDVFHGKHDGFLLAEVEFDSVEQARAFQAPDWFGVDVSGQMEYSNSYMALR